MFLSLWPILSIQFCLINLLYLIIGTLLFITYGSINCLRAKKVSTTKSDAVAPEQPKKAIVEHSIRLSYHNELPKSEVSGECSPNTTIKHCPGSTATFLNLEHTQSGALCSKDLPPSKHISKLYHKAQTTIKKSPIVGSEKLIEDKTQLSIPSMDFTQLTTTSEEYDKESSKTLTESTLESKEQNNAKNALLNLEHSKVSPETLILNITMSKESDAAQRNSKRQLEVNASGIGTNHISTTEDSKQSITSPLLSVQPG